MDIHEFTLTPGGDALFTVYSPILVHLPGSPSGTLSPLLDSIVQQVDVRTGLVVWEWHSYGHIPLADSYATPENSASYDAYHINSIQNLNGGRVLISARDTSAVYEIDRATGRIRWTLGGKANDFQHRHDARFWFQHDAQLLPGHRISDVRRRGGSAEEGAVLAGPVPEARTRASARPRSSSSTSARATPPRRARAACRRARSGNVFVGFGSRSRSSRSSRRAAGSSTTGACPKDDGSYRTFRYRWHGDPADEPDARRQVTGSSKVAAFASWNGATAVKRWELLAGPEEDDPPDRARPEPPDSRPRSTPTGASALRGARAGLERRRPRQIGAGPAP